MTAAPGLLAELARGLESGGVSLSAWGLGWARVAPTVAIVPAFGLRALPGSARVLLALTLGFATAPALASSAPSVSAWPVRLLLESAKGVPVAISAASALWIASMVGGLVDDLRGGKETAALPNLEQGTSPSGALLGIVAAVAFLESGGPARVVQRLADPALTFAGPFARAVQNVSSGIEIAVAIAAPVVVASVVVEVTSTLIARAASPASIQSLFAPLRSLALLGVLALVFDRVVELLVLVQRRG